MSAAACAFAGGCGYSLVEASWLNVYHQPHCVAGRESRTVSSGLRAAFLTDLHHGPWTSLAYIRAAIRTAAELNADLILLGGDFSHNGPGYVDPCIEALGELRAPLGVHAVLGNHDYYNNASLARASLDRHRVVTSVQQRTVAGTQRRPLVAGRCRRSGLRATETQFGDGRIETTRARAARLAQSRFCGRLQ